MTRKDEVLERLRMERGEWVNGSELATVEVGGSEGLKRLRELRAEGWPIEERRHPDPRRAVWQYRLLEADARGKIRVEREGKPDQYIDPRRAAAESAQAMRTLEDRERANQPRIPPGQLRIVFGEIVCRWCRGTGGTVERACWSCSGTGKTSWQ